MIFLYYNLWILILYFYIISFSFLYKFTGIKTIVFIVRSFEKNVCFSCFLFKYGRCWHLPYALSKLVYRTCVLFVRNVLLSHHSSSKQELVLFISNISNICENWSNIGFACCNQLGSFSFNYCVNRVSVAVSIAFVTQWNCWLML